MEPEWLKNESQATFLPIKDRYLDLPRRITVINDDDILNLKIALNTAHNFEEFINQL